MRIPALDLHAAVEEERRELDAAWNEVASHGTYILGDQVSRFEHEFATFCGTRDCIGVASGLDALRLLLQALDIGVEDEVIVPAYTAVATWMAVTAVGATPVGVDVEPTTFNVDPSLIEELVTERTKAIIAVHLFGRPSDIAAVQEVADRRDLLLIEDAAQAHGARVADRRVGSLARAAAFSFYPTKNLGALGDGGAITTDDLELAERVRMLRAYGWRTRSVSEIFGVNSRLDELQAAFLRTRLARLAMNNRRRRELADAYGELLAAAPGVELPPGGDSSLLPVWHLYPVRVDARDGLQVFLAERGIGSLVHYDPLPHLTPAYRRVGWADGAFPVAEMLARRELSLPFYPQLSLDAAREVAHSVLEWAAQTSR